MFGIRGFLMKDELYKSFIEELYSRPGAKADIPPQARDTVLRSRYGDDPDQITWQCIIRDPSEKKEKHYQILTEEMAILERGNVL